MPDDLPEEAKHGRAVVAFIDLLGFGQTVVQAISNWDQNPAQAFTDTVTKVIKAQSSFETPEWKSGVSPAIEEDRTVIALSDSIIWNCPIQNPTAQRIGTYNHLLLLFESLAISQFQCIQEGTFVRGAIDVGFTFRLKTALVSDALVRAVEAEKSWVRYPVIAITPHLWDLMEEAGKADPGAHRDNKQIVTIPITTKKNEPIDLRFLNYLRIVGDAEADYHSVLSIHKERVEFALTNALACARDKYHWLIGYHNKFIDELGGPLSNLKIDLPQSTGTD